uniref:2-oxoglutarate-dependent dioxygenase htyE-like isoform X1 n=1 Tax=Ciona intestinalis TaxID=7719 RepID=UPI000180D402|nr:2-oxoglutarate-dependent dioxygenase htyE-like isoform X1 [Ciona intestinalis]|eukprot:XP_002122275.1 2-oxoglutarate-dependent dioxygenase htyE-like isoform X1 [Ciona intestinalis]
MLPIIDFKQCRPDVEVSDKEINETGQANGGCFVHSRFCISKELWNKKRNCRRTRNTADEIFNAPTDKKNIYKRNPITTFGYIGFSTEKVDPALPVDYKEAFNVPGCALDPSVGAKWPHELSPNFAPLTKSFMEECKSLALIILEVIAVGLQIKDRHVLQNAHQHLNLKHSLGGALKYLYYPPIKEDVKPEQKRLGEHSDWGSITLLFVDNTGGLQIETEGTYKDVPVIEDTILINIGDALEYWTKGKLKSTKHRINIPQDEWRRNSSRRSIVYFAYPDNDVVINQPLQFKGDADVPDPVKDPITALKYCEIKMKEAHVY